jgi:hypothetical protein
MAIGVKFDVIVVVSFLVEESTRKKPPTSRKSLKINFTTLVVALQNRLY